MDRGGGPAGTTPPIDWASVTKLAVITDVHADVHALRDALAQIDKLGIEKILCCGDLIDYDLFPDLDRASLIDKWSRLADRRTRWCHVTGLRRPRSTFVIRFE